MNFYIIKFLQIYLVFIIITGLFSLLLCACGYNIFKKTNKKPKMSFIPFYNLLVLLDIVEMSKLYFVLLLLPVVNIVTIYLMLYRLSIVFHTSKYFALGLILLSIVFLPILSFSKKMEEKEETEYDDVSSEMMTILTQDKYDELNKKIEDEPKVDSIFKSRIKEEEPAPVFKANKIKYREMVMDKVKIEKIEKVEPTLVKDIYKSKFIDNKITEEDDSIEIIEL